MRPVEDLERIYSLYQEHLNKEEYCKAHIWLTKYIEYAEEKNVRGNYYYKLEDLKTFLVLSSFPNEVKEKEKKLLEEYKKLLNEKKYPEALECSEKYFNLLQGKTAHSYLYFAKVCTLLGKYSESNIAINNALEINPYSPFGFVELIKLNILTGKTHDALENINELIQIDKKTHHSSFLYLYEVYYMMGEIDKANEVLEEGCRILKGSQKLELENKAVLFIQNIPKIKKGDTSNAFKPYMGIIKSYLVPDKDNVVRPRLIDGYIKSLNLSDEDTALLKLKTAKLLEENRYSDRAAKMIKEVEQTKNKTEEVKKQLVLVRNDVKLIRNR